MTLTVCASQNVHDFGDLPALLMLVAARDGVFDAMAHMVSHDFLLGAAERPAHGRNLGDNVNAVTVFFNHADDTADLTLNSAQPFQDRGFCFISHS